VDMEQPANVLATPKIDLGFATRNALRKAPKLSDWTILAFRRDCATFLKNCAKKIAERSPLKFKLTRGSSCLDPACALIPELGERRVCGSNKDLFAFVKLILSLSHGNASVERGFSINKDCLVENQKEQSLVAQRIVYDAVSSAGGVASVQLTKRMLQMDGTIAVKQWASTPPAPVKITNWTGYRKEQVRRSFAAQDLKLSDDTTDAIATARLAVKLAGDDVPALLPEIRARSRAELARREIFDIHVRREKLDAALTEMADHVAFLVCAEPAPSSFT
ncbi:hypothetical protein HPB47_000599, partial [Ixodes persulcatus]